MSILPLQFDGPAREELQQVAAQFCSYQSIALELIKTKQRKESRFQLFMQVSWAMSQPSFISTRFTKDLLTSLLVPPTSSSTEEDTQQHLYS